VSLAATLAAVIVLLSASAALAPDHKDELLKDEQHRLQQSQTLYQGGQKAAAAFNMEVVGQHDLGGRGFNADVGPRGLCLRGALGVHDSRHLIAERLRPVGRPRARQHHGPRSPLPVPLGLGGSGDAKVLGELIDVAVRGAEVDPGVAAVVDL
jgi:hypothetical protein